MIGYKTSTLGSICLMGAHLLAHGDGQEYRNPFIPGMNPDPPIIWMGSEYFLTMSLFEYFPSCSVYHSFDLVHWERIGYALSRPEQFAALHSEHPSTYACTLRYHAGRFYALTTNVRGGGNFLISTKDRRKRGGIL